MSFGRVEVFGSPQRWLVQPPPIIVRWNGVWIGNLEHGGTFGFDLERGGEVSFEPGGGVSFALVDRSARLLIQSPGTTEVQLTWDRIWGRIRAMPR